jgi:hypothetical protein
MLSICWLPQLLQVHLQDIEVVVLGHPRIPLTPNFLHHSELVLCPQESLRFVWSQAKVVEGVNCGVQVECCIG